MDACCFMLYRHDERRAFSPGEQCYVMLRSQHNTGRATILDTPDSLAPDSEFAGRYRVRFTTCGATAHVRPERLLPVFQGQEQQQQAQQQEPLVLLVANTVDYRRLARSQVTKADGVLELGCSYGVASRMLAEHGAWFVGVDNSSLMVDEARQRNPGLRFEQVDVFEQPAAVLDLAAHGGSSSSSTGTAAGGGGADSTDTPDSGAADATDSSSSSCSCSRATVVFADIGGNRALEALVRLVPWVLQELSPRLLVVKSRELAAAAARWLAQQQQQQQPPEQQAQKDGAVSQLQEQLQQQQLEPEAESPQAQPVAPAAQDSTSIQDMAGWWALLRKQLQEQLEADAGIPASAAAELWFVAARAGGFRCHPMRYPHRQAPGSGVRICRPHNYDRARGCLKGETGCPFDHRHCHYCLAEGHRAVDCPAGLQYVPSKTPPQAAAAGDGAAAAAGVAYGEPSLQPS